GSNPSAEGASSAPNAPWSIRAATSTPKDWASPPIAEAIENPTKPMTRAQLRPNRSPSLPPSSSRLPKASAYAVTIHCRFSVEKCSAFWAEGIAMVTIVASSTTISCATLSRVRTAHRFGSRSVGASDIRWTSRSRVADDVLVCVVPEVLDHEAKLGQLVRERTEHRLARRQLPVGLQLAAEREH